MNSQKLNHYRDVLEDLARRVRATSKPLEEATRIATGGDATGGLSSTPMHLGDLGSEAYTQELNATLLMNEEFLGQEIDDAIGRHERGVFGTCEECKHKIPESRLDALPYARYCVKCAEKLHAGADPNLNRGRPQGWGSTLEHPNQRVAEKREGEQSPFNAPRKDTSAIEEDRHAVGTPGGGTAIGGLGGTNSGDGDPDNTPLEEAMGSGNFDASNKAEEDEAGTGQAFGGPSGGAVGGTPANKRSVGGKDKAGISQASAAKTKDSDELGGKRNSPAKTPPKSRSRSTSNNITKKGKK
ncbi:MAG: TraR/DksA family transcriptional regulator [Planctomycetes bacterium]|nr:TraR/DksA family transcriptional regulator [Planctomycetota bacterium]